MATLLSLNVGMPKDVAWNGRTVHTGIYKRPVEGPRMVRKLNVDGDGQGDLGGHGGEPGALLLLVGDRDAKGVEVGVGCAARAGRGGCGRRW